MQAVVDESLVSEREACVFLKCSRVAFQRWKRATPSTRTEEDTALTPLVVSIFHRHRRRYGTRRIVEELRDQGLHVSRRRVAKMLKNAGLSVIQPRSFRPRTTESRHTLGYSPNLLLDLAEPSRPNCVWVGDITYVPVSAVGFCYLAMLLDRFSRRIVGWAIAEDMTETLVSAALRQAISDRQPPVGLIHHTDRGGQYAAARYRSMLRRAALRQSMSRAGDCYDNAFMESCFGTIKTELQMTEYPSYRDARQELAEYIAYYNRERKHSALGYLTPTQFELSPRRR